MKEIFSRSRRKQTGTERKSTGRNREEKSGNQSGSEPADPDEIHTVYGGERDAAEEARRGRENG